MKYYIRTVINGDEFLDGSFETATEAIETAESDFKHLTKHDQNRRSSVAVIAKEDDEYDDYDIVGVIK